MRKLCSLDDLLLFLLLVTDYHKRQESELSDRCKGIQSMLQYNLLAYTSQPIPFLGKVDLAAVFLARRKFAFENVLFGKFETALFSL